MKKLPRPNQTDPHTECNVQASLHRVKLDIALKGLGVSLDCSVIIY